MTGQQELQQELMVMQREVEEVAMVGEHHCSDRLSLCADWLGGPERDVNLNEMFPVVDAEAPPTANPQGYANLLCKQLDHLGCGNVLYLHTDLASSLAWDIDHWFPCAREGETVLRNLWMTQWQVCQKKQNKLEFLMPRWDLQLGVFVNQFISIFASKNMDFRKRAFMFLFTDDAKEELNSLQLERKFTSETDENVSLVVPSRGPSSMKENSNSDADGYISNPYLSIAMARESLRQREEAKKKQAELTELENEGHELTRKNEEQVAIQRKWRVEKSHRLVEAQFNYKAVLEKMIRDAMHQ
ncbi:hypothetical protein PR202_ga23275 [Eleusine coracana subsp. coracana]|uniref:Uncharacterized protein n=1 Tax=Eleusine coracana subsp. coracana TaxID=191504 RepID=A0AAV5D5F4_ELECO|nr:hypothetical protein PR202_ga23275 [Eleusine coracana subsp. coracana]